MPGKIKRADLKNIVESDFIVKSNIDEPRKHKGKPSPSMMPSTNPENSVVTSPAQRTPLQT